MTVEFVLEPDIEIDDWYGVDLDGTLAEYAKFDGTTKIGKPIPRMVLFVKELIAEGKTVKILTARVATKNRTNAQLQETSIRKWCQEHIGQELEVTCEKDPGMRSLYDDRAYHVIRNTGRIVGLQYEQD